MATEELGIRIRADQRASGPLQEVKRASQDVTKSIETANRAMASAAQSAGRAWSQASATVRSAEETIRKAGRETAQAMHQVAEQAQKIRPAAGGAMDAIRGVGDALSLLAGPLRIVRAAFEAGGRVLGVVSGALGALASVAIQAAQAIGGTLLAAARETFGFLGGAARIGVLALVAALGLLAKRGVDVNLSLHATQAALAGILRSQGAAASFLREIRQEARVSAFEFVDLADMSKRLLALGFARDEVLPTIRTLADTSAAMGGGKGLLDRLVLAFGQIRAKGQLMGGEALQLTEAGINVREAVGLPLGRDFGEEKIPAAVALPRILAFMQERFGGQQGAMVETLPGRLSNIADAMNDLTASVTEGLVERLTRAAGALLQFVSGLADAGESSRIFRAVRALFDRLGDAVEHLATRLPEVVGWLERFFDSELFRRAGEIALNALEMIRDGLIGVGRWIAENWQGIWLGAQNVVVEVVGIVGGAIAGLAAVVADFARGGAQDIRAFLRGLAEFGARAVEIFGGIAVHAGRVGALMFSAFALSPVGLMSLKMKPREVFDVAFNIRQMGADIGAGAGPLASFIRGRSGLDDLVGAAAGRQDSLGTFARAFGAFRGSVRQQGLMAIPGMSRLFAGRPRGFAALQGQPQAPQGSDLAPGHMLVGQGRVSAPTPGGAAEAPDLDTIEAMVNLAEERLRQNPQAAEAITRGELVPALQMQMSALARAASAAQGAERFKLLLQLERVRGRLREAVYGKAPGAAGVSNPFADALQGAPGAMPGLPGAVAPGLAMPAVGGPFGSAVFTGPQGQTVVNFTAQVVVNAPEQLRLLFEQFAIELQRRIFSAGPRF